MTGCMVGCVADYLIIPIIGGIMGSSNLVGYFKCSREAKDQFKDFTSGLMKKAATQAVTHSLNKV